MKYLRICNTVHVAVINITKLNCDLEPFSKIQSLYESHNMNFMVMMCRLDV